MSQSCQQPQAHPARCGCEQSESPLSELSILRAANKQLEAFRDRVIADRVSAPAPPAGDVEVLSCASFARSGNIQCWSLQRDHASLRKLEGEGHTIIELVDRQHLVGLSAQLATSEKWAREHCNRAESFAGQIIELTDRIESLDQQNPEFAAGSKTAVLPSRKEYASEDDEWFRGQGKGWNDCIEAYSPIVTRLQAVNAALQARLTVADEQVDILSGGLRLMTSFGSGTNISGVKTVAKQTLNRAAAVPFNADTPAPK